MQVYKLSTLWQTSSAVGRSFGSKASNLSNSLNAKGSALGNFCANEIGCFFLIVVKYLLAFSFRTWSWHFSLYLIWYTKIKSITKFHNKEQICLPEIWYLMTASPADLSLNLAGEQHFYQGKVASRLILRQKCSLCSICQWQGYTASKYIFNCNKLQEQSFKRWTKEEKTYVG